MVYSIRVAGKLIIRTQDKALAERVCRLYRKLYEWDRSAVRASYALVR